MRSECAHRLERSVAWRSKNVCIGGYIGCEQSLLCSKIHGEKVAEHEPRASGEAASSACAGRRAKRETAMVSYNDCEALWQFVSVTTPPIFKYDILISRAFISRLRMISGWNGYLWKFISRLNFFLQNKFWSQNKNMGRAQHSECNALLLWGISEHWSRVCVCGRLPETHAVKLCFRST